MFGFQAVSCIDLVIVVVNCDFFLLSKVFPNQGIPKVKESRIPAFSARAMLGWKILDVIAHIVKNTQDVEDWVLLGTLTTIVIVSTTSIPVAPQNSAFTCWLLPPSQGHQNRFFIFLRLIHVLFWTQAPVLSWTYLWKYPQYKVSTPFHLSHWK